MDDPDPDGWPEGELVREHYWAAYGGPEPLRVAGEHWGRPRRTEVRPAPGGWLSGPGMAQEEER